MLIYSAIQLSRGQGNQWHMKLNSQPLAQHDSKWLSGIKSVTICENKWKHFWTMREIFVAVERARTEKDWCSNVQHLPAVFRVTLLGFLVPTITIRSIQERVEKLASGARLLHNKNKVEINIFSLSLKSETLGHNKATAYTEERTLFAKESFLWMNSFFS